MRNELPDTCFATLPGTGDLIILKRGETGYYRSDWNTSDADENRSIAEIHNQRRGITPAQVEAMKVGSMFGFHVPGTSPQFYYDNAVYARSSPLQAGTTISHPRKAAHAPVEGELLQYYVAKQKCLYLEMQTMPELLLSKQSGIILLPDMICGRPLIPVSTLTQEKGRMEIVLENGSTSTDKEVNADYRIIAKVSVGPVEYALGQINARVPFFVTWERTPANDQAGSPNYYWGHYFDKRENAIWDFCARAQKKYKMMTKDNRLSIKEQLAASPVTDDKPKTKPKDREAR